jgi:hypothetical protein
VLTDVDGTPVVALVYASENYRPELIVEVVGADRAHRNSPGVLIEIPHL